MGRERGRRGFCMKELCKKEIGGKKSGVKMGNAEVLQSYGRVLTSNGALMDFADEAESKNHLVFWERVRDT